MSKLSVLYIIQVILLYVFTIELIGYKDYYIYLSLEIGINQHV